MASAMATAASRSMPPPYTISLGPRIRPPRLLPGTKAANTNPQPRADPPFPGAVWVQGKWRVPSSNAAKDRREVQSAKAEKALRHATHGTNIYAYSNIRTNQVVYSLTRVMENTTILPQLLFHGKQTVPSALRRDVWRPYFSMHFPKTPAGIEAGLQAYHQLREISVQRQLSPPTDFLIATEADVKKAKAKYTPYILDAKMKGKKEIKNLPIKNQLLPKRLRAKKLMDQKATSVADAAYVLDLINKGLSPHEQLNAISEERQSKLDQMSSRAKRRLRSIKEIEANKLAQIEARQDLIQPGPGQLGMAYHTANRIALEHQGLVVRPKEGLEFKVQQLKALEDQESATKEYLSSISGEDVLVQERRPANFDIKAFEWRYKKMWKESAIKNGDNVDLSQGPSAEKMNEARQKEEEAFKARIADYERRVEEGNTKHAQSQTGLSDASRLVEVRWADIRDATWAEQWSTNVRHSALELRAAIKYPKNVVLNKNTIDGKGNMIPEEIKILERQSSTTPHVFGGSQQEGWYMTPEQLAEEQQRERSTELAEWSDQKLERSKTIIHRISDMQEQHSQLLVQRTISQPELEIAGVVIQDLTLKEEKDLMKDVETSVEKTDQKLKRMKTRYPELSKKSSDLVSWREHQKIYFKLSLLRDEILELQPRLDSGEDAAYQRIQGIDGEIASYANSHENLSILSSLEANLALRQSRELQQIRNLENNLKKLEKGENEDEIFSIQSEIRNRQSILDSDRSKISSERLNVIEETLNAIESDTQYTNTDVMSLQRQRVYAEQQRELAQIAYNKMMNASGQVPKQIRPTVAKQKESEIAAQSENPQITGEQVDTNKQAGAEVMATPEEQRLQDKVDALYTIEIDLKAREDEFLNRMLGYESATRELRLAAVNMMQEQPIEMPKPGSSTGIFGRIKNFFGR